MSKPMQMHFGHQNVFSTLEEPRFLSIKWHQDEKSGMGKPKEMHKKFISDNKFSSAEKNGDLRVPNGFFVQYILVLTFYSTRLARQKFYLEKKLHFKVDYSLNTVCFGQKKTFGPQRVQFFSADENL